MTRIKSLIVPLAQPKPCQPTSTIEHALDKLRHTLNIPEIQDYYIKLLKPNNGWKRLCAALDALRDSQRAIDKYKTIGDVDHITGDSLLLYGILNALYIQQDSIRTWGELIGEKIDFRDYPDTLRVREIRDDICHASDRGLKSGVSKFQIFIIPVSYRQYYFEYLRFTTATSTPETIHVDLAKCISDQERDIVSIINLFIQKITTKKRSFEKDNYRQ